MRRADAGVPPVSEPEQLTVEANGIAFGALAWGDPDAPLALLIHGYPDTAWTWRHLGPYLAARGRRAVAPFTRGYAPTDLAPDDRYRISALADDVLALHRALGGGADAALVGHDWGAAVTWAVTQHEPDHFARYVAMAMFPAGALTLPWYSPRTVGLGLRQLRRSWYVAFNQLPGAEHTADRLIPRLWRDWSPGFDGREDVARVLAALDTPARRRAALRYYRDTLRHDLLATLTQRAGAPALYLHGAQDGCVQPALAALHAPELPAGSRFEMVPGCGHFLHLEDPGAVNTQIGDWLACTPGSPPRPAPRRGMSS
jgi:pimeloyl-ACP methyl ester carboxylesterase